MKKPLNKETTATERKFRPRLGTPKPYQNLNLDPNYNYRWVITTYENDMTGHDRIDYFIDRGWEVVSNTDRPKDERSFVPDNDTSTGDRLKPVIKRIGRHSQTLMRCHKEQAKANELGKAQRDLDNYKKATKVEINRKRNETVYISPDIDLSQPEDMSE